jgi:hypothetical protein
MGLEGYRREVKEDEVSKRGTIGAAAIVFAVAGVFVAMMALMLRNDKKHEHIITVDAVRNDGKLHTAFVYTSKTKYQIKCEDTDATTCFPLSTTKEYTLKQSDSAMSTMCFTEQTVGTMCYQIVNEDPK